MTALRRFFGERFRVFFLGAGLSAILSMAIWVGWQWPAMTGPRAPRRAVKAAP